MPYFQLESSHSLPEHRYIPVAFIRTAPVYLQTGDKKAVIELPLYMDPTKTLAHYKQKISAKKAVLAPSKYVLTEITLAEYDAASIYTPPRVDRSRSPHRTLARHTPLESVREQLNKMQHGELQQLLGLVAARMYTPRVISPQTTLLDVKAAIQRALLVKPYTEWASVLAPFIAECRANPAFNEREVDEIITHGSHGNVKKSRTGANGPFEEAIDFLYNWPPHEGSGGIFRETRSYQLDPRISMRTWRKRGPLCDHMEVNRHCSGKGPHKVPHEAHEVFYAQVAFIDCNGAVSPTVDIKMNHFLENKAWARDCPPPSLALWASTQHRFQYAGLLCNYVDRRVPLDQKALAHYHATGALQAGATNAPCQVTTYAQFYPQDPEHPQVWHKDHETPEPTETERLAGLVANQGKYCEGEAAEAREPAEPVGCMDMDAVWHHVEAPAPSRHSAKALLAKYYDDEEGAEACAYSAIDASCEPPKRDNRHCDSTDYLADRLKHVALDASRQVP